MQDVRALRLKDIKGPLNKEHTKGVLIELRDSYLAVQNISRSEEMTFQSG